MTAHLASAMALLGLLVFILVRSYYPARISGRGASQRFTLLADVHRGGRLRAAAVRLQRHAPTSQWSCSRTGR